MLSLNLTAGKVSSLDQRDGLGWIQMQVQSDAQSLHPGSAASSLQAKQAHGRLRTESSPQWPRWTPSRSLSASVQMTPRLDLPRTTGFCCFGPPIEAIITASIFSSLLGAAVVDGSPILWLRLLTTATIYLEGQVSGKDIYNHIVAHLVTAQYMLG